MAFIKFTNRKKPVEAQAKKLNNHQIEISGCAINTSGFSYYQDAEMKRKFGDYEDFTTLYQKLDESYILSNDGSVYPEQPEQEQEPTLREVVEKMGDELTNTQIAMTENYEQGVAIAEEVTNTQIAVIEIYEMLLGGM